MECGHLSPEWVLKHGLGREGAEPIQVQFPALGGGLLEGPRFKLPEFTFTVRGDALVLLPGTVENTVGAENAVAKMLEVLGHTPVNGVGHNFEFVDNDPDPALLAAFSNSRQDLADHFPNGWQPAAASISSSFAAGNGAVVANIQRSFDGAAVTVKFNFHHPVASVGQVLSLLKGEEGYNRMKQNYELAIKLIHDLYGELDGNEQ